MAVISSPSLLSGGVVVVATEPALVDRKGLRTGVVTSVLTVTLVVAAVVGEAVSERDDEEMVGESVLDRVALRSTPRVAIVANRGQRRRSQR